MQISVPIDPMRSRVECDHRGTEQPNGTMIRCTACGCTWHEGQTPPPHVYIRFG